MIDVLDKIGGGSAPLEEDDPNRPAWIPLNIVADWDPDPYAYQTEEELMSQGALHDLLMTYISQVMPNHLAQYGLVLWKDIFMLYRNSRGIKKRVGPDLLLAEDGTELEMESWDMDRMPVPECLGEITSRRSRKQDLDSKCKLYHKLGVCRYLVIDGHDDKGTITGNISIRVWKDGQEQRADEDGFLHIPELHVKAKPLDTDLVFYHEDSLEPLLDIKTAELRLTELATEKKSLVSENMEQAQKIHELEERLRKLEE